MAEQLLHGADVVARLQQVRGKRMAQMHAAKTGFEVFLIQRPGLLQLSLQGADRVFRQLRHPVFIALASGSGVSAARCGLAMKAPLQPAEHEAMSSVKF